MYKKNGKKKTKIELFQRILELSMGKSLERWMAIWRLGIL
jgi:hypothetical protein